LSKRNWFYSLLVVLVLISGIKESLAYNRHDIHEQYEYLEKIESYDLYRIKGEHITAQVLEKIYQDEANEYYLPSLESHLYLLVNDKESIGLKEALKQKKISINGLVESQLNIYVMPKH
jgi:hypothetical protein